MQKIKKIIHWKVIIPVEIILGFLIMISAFVIAINVDMNKAEKELRTTVEYMKNQCNDSEIRDMASEAKSLLRVTESVEQIRWRLKYEPENQRKDYKDTLETYAEDSYLDGIILLDKDGNVEEQMDKSGLGCDTVMKMVDKGTLMDPMHFEEKTYAIRVVQEDEAHVDIASVNRSDGDGIIVGYFYTPAAYVSVVNNSIRAIVSGFVPEKNGTIVISSGNQIVVSNDKKLEGTQVEDTAILKKIMERGTGEKLIHAKNQSSKFSNHFGLMDKSKDYYIYAFMNEKSVFRTTFPNVLSIMFIYVVLLIVTDVLLRKAEGVYQQNQIASQKEYMEILEQNNKQLESALMQAQKANEAKGNFLSRMSHDMRTPLNGIIGLIKINEDHYENQTLVKENYQKIRVSAKHLLALINDVLQMSKLEDGNIVLTHEVIDLSELTQDIVAIIGNRALEAGISWEYEKDKKEIAYPYIYGSPVHLRQIFLDIYGNCIKYNRQNGKITTIAEALEEHDGIVTYRWTIMDTGIGMSKEFLNHIFEPFVQEKNDARSVYNGTGLGMAIVKELITQMNGTITVESEEGIGSTFVITIPFETAPAPVQSSDIRKEEVDISGRKIMLVEDNELNAEIGEMLLVDQGVKVTTVSDGKQAVELFASQPEETFDMILMDIMMPVMDGLTATKTIRAMDRPDAKTIPIIAMTANAFQDDVDKCLEAGMNAHLAKPLNMELLKKTMKEQFL